MLKKCRFSYRLYRIFFPTFLLCLSLGLFSCDGTSKSNKELNASDSDLLALIDTYELTGDPASKRNLSQFKPSDDPIAKLGQILFFSQSLSGSFDSSCATCHLPELGGSDGLSLSVGVVPLDRRINGPGRVVNNEKDRDPSADGGPNMHRNSITTFNSALFDRFLMSDGRVRVADFESEISPGGMGQVIWTPETGLGGDQTDASGFFGLLEVVSKFPISNDNEMRGFLYADLSHPDDFRKHLMERLKGNVDVSYMAEGAADKWLELYRNAFDVYFPDGGSGVINLLTTQVALGRYMKSQIFVETPWKQYVQGEPDAISERAKKGAILFFTNIEDGGLGCAKCHAGDRFTNETFYNVGFPQIGRGFQRADKSDVGRWQITRNKDDWFAFRVPSLLNVTLTAPYGHAGTFGNLRETLRYHVNPKLASIDFNFSNLQQIAELGVSYPKAEGFANDALNNASFLKAKSLLPMRDLSINEEEALVAFLNALTDICASSETCISQWIPSKDEDPDGHLLVGNEFLAPDLTEDAGVVEPGDYPASIALLWPTVEQRTNFTDIASCPDGLSDSQNAGTNFFVRKDTDLGLLAKHGFEQSTWIDNWFFESAMIAGGVTASYLNNDCWPDILMTGGDANGLVSYINKGGQLGFDRDDSYLSGTINASSYKLFSSVSTADLNGDFRRELVLSNLLEGDTVVLAQGDNNNIYEEVARLPMTRNTYGISFGDINSDSYLDFFLPHWDSRGVRDTSPALWLNSAGDSLLNFDAQAGTSSVYLDQQWNFTPKFIDVRNVGVQDLLIASDFRTSTVMKNDGGGVFGNVTDTDVISDENGMGAALGDVNNDGLLDWFVTSVYDPDAFVEGNWGITGNRLYLNESQQDEIKFTDITEGSGVRDGNWGWGACMADFNQDGFIDIFHVNGFGYVPEEIGDGDIISTIISLYAELASTFIGTTPRLFINNGDETFSEESFEWGLALASEGRGVICLDYDRDGDIDIGLLDHSTGIQFFENQIGNSAGKRFLNIRLIGTSPNTDAIGAKVYLTADVGVVHGVQTQMRVSEANSNFNSQNLPDLHFGIGEAVSVDLLKVEWTDGSGLLCVDVPANQFLMFDQRDRDWPKLDGLSPSCNWYADISAI